MSKTWSRIQHERTGGDRAEYRSSSSSATPTLRVLEVDDHAIVLEDVYLYVECQSILQT